MDSVKTWAGRFDQSLEAYILGSHGSAREKARTRLGKFALSSVLVAALVKYLTGPVAAIDIFVLALVFTSIVFRRQGYPVIGVALLLDLLVKYLAVARIGRPELWSKFLLDTAIHALEWTVVCSFVIVTLDKWAAVRRIQRRIDDDLALAKSLQSSLARKSCFLKRINIWGSIHQCDSVGGDFYYFRPFDKKMVSLCLGDVMGKGISSSLLMAMVMSFVYEWGKTNCSPSIVAERLNHRLSHLWDGRKGWFITLFYALLDEETGRLDYCAAGQQGGFLLREGALSEIVSDCDPPLGVTEPYSFEVYTVQLQPGDRVLLFTDGVYEAKSPHEELFGIQRLGELFQRLGEELEGDELLNRLEQAVLEHTGGVYTDDTTLLLLHYSE